jgi:hyperosmotically inducible protein
MHETTHRISAATFAVVLLACSCPARAQQGPVGQGLNEAGRAVKRGFQTAGQAVSGGFQKTKNSVHNMEVVSRVYSRLHWDKALTGANMEIEVQAGGVAILTGAVPNEEAKAKALVLTSETVGVNEVVDRLTVVAVTKPARVVPGAPPTVVVPPTPSGTIIVTPPSSVVVPPATTKPNETDTPL